MACMSEELLRLNLIYRWADPDLSPRGGALLEKCLQSGQWSHGPIAMQAETEIACLTNSEAALLTNTGTSALWLLLKLIRTREPQAIILPAFGYAAAANVAANLGFEIYVADTEEKAPVIDPASVSRLLDEKVTAVVGINYFGYSVEWDSMPQGTFQLIEDAAGSFGASYNGRPAGSNANSGIFSFHTTKAVSAAGEGGCLIGRRVAVESARVVARNGLDPNRYYFSLSTGLNMLMTDIGACFLLDAMRRSMELLAIREQIATHFAGILAGYGVNAPAFNASEPHRRQNYQVFTVLLRDRDLAIEIMRLNGIEARPCWPCLLTDQSVYKPWITKQDGNLRSARAYANHIVNIPINPIRAHRLLGRLEQALKQISGFVYITEVLE